MTMTDTTTKPPRHLKAATRRWYAGVVADYALDPHHVKLLILACEALDRYQEARQVLADQGMTYEDRFGAPKPRPEVAIERDSRLGFARLLRELGLDVAEPVEAPRPRLLPAERRAS